MHLFGVFREVERAKDEYVLSCGRSAMSIPFFVVCYLRMLLHNLETSVSRESFHVQIAFTCESDVIG